MKPTNPTPSKDRITLEHLAQAAGISRSAASKAMRNHPEIGEATRKRVQSLAKEMGYIRDPILSRLADYRWSTGSPGRNETIAYLFPYKSGQGHHQPIHDTCKRVFTEEGFAFESFYAGDHTPAQLRRILRARGIRGIILHRIKEQALADMLCHAGFACVAIAEGPVIPPCELIREDQLANLRDALNRLREAGRTRPALVIRQADLGTALLQNMEGIWLAAGHPPESIVCHDAADPEFLPKQLLELSPDGLVFPNWLPLPDWFWKQADDCDPSRQIVLRLFENQTGKLSGYHLQPEKLARRAAYYLESRLKRAGEDELYGMTLLPCEWCPADDSW